MLADESRTDSFAEFVEGHERKLRQALTAAFDPEMGVEATAEALAYGWEHWPRIAEMANPAGYLYRVGYDRARRMRSKRLRLPIVDQERTPWVEPGLPEAFASLPEKQRFVVALVHGYQWSLREVAEYMGVSKSTAQSHVDRALKTLRRKLGVRL